MGMALFALFFGAGNLILPPQLGFRAGTGWVLVGMGFVLSAVLIPMLGILAHARLQGSMFDFPKKVSPAFSLVYCYLIYAIALTLPAPRTASVTHEMAVAPFWDIPPLLTSLIYFALVYVVVINRSQVTSLIGKWLTPAILLVLVLLIGSITLFHGGVPGTPQIDSPLSTGILEGYQTFDAIGAVVVGGVILISLNLEQPNLTQRERFRMVVSSGALAGLALLALYVGLIYSGALMHGVGEAGMSRTGLLSAMSQRALGSWGERLLSLLIGLACFTTAAGVVTGAADFFKERFGGSNKAYRITVLAGCLLGVLMGQLPVGVIIAVALPVLMFIYPLTVVLILLNALPPRLAPAGVIRAVSITTLIFSVPDLLGSLGVDPGWGGMLAYLPLREFQMGWVIPATLVYFLFLGFLRTVKPGQTPGQ